MNPELFRNTVAKALRDVPVEFLRKMENVEVLVEEFADEETLDSLGIESPWDLLGLYVGVPMDQQSFFSPGYLPERIYLYRRPILRAARGGKSLVQLIREVVIHEIGHHFGFDDDELDAMTEGPS
jgi:predicted Zn-dependent protease with MMP-like domain